MQWKELWTEQRGDQMKTVFELIEANGLTLHGDIEHFAELVRAEERERIVELVDEHDGWIARQISGEPEEPLPDVDRNAMLKELLPEIEKMFNVEYKAHEFPHGIPFVTQDELERLRKEHE